MTYTDRFFTDALTFILFVSVYDSTFGEIVWRHFYRHTVSGKDLDVVHPHLSRYMGQQLVPVFKFDFKSSVG